MALKQLSRCHVERNAPRFWARGVEAPLWNQRGTVQQGPFDSLRSLKVTPDIRFSVAHRVLLSAFKM